MSKTVAKYQRYAEYKDSGIVWMGNVPKHWTSERFKWSLTEKLKTSNPNLPAGSISFGEVIYKNEENLSSDTKASYQEVLKDEFLINPLNLNYDLKSLRTALSKIDVVVSTGYIVLHCNHLLDRNYVRWLLQEFDVAHMKTLGAGVRQTVNFSDIANCYFYLPEQLEQRKIAHFLDHETAKIDSLIEKQQQLIQLLKEKRQAVISHAVTKGLNPDVPMKDSGVEWLGQVPEHWRIVTLKYLVTAPIIDGPHVSPIKYDEGVPFISAEAVSSGYIDFDKKWGYISQKDHDLYSKRYKPQLGDLLIVKLGATTGTVAIVETEEEFNVWVPLATVRVCQKKFNSKFLYYLFQSAQIKDAIQQSWTFGTQQTLGLGTISNFRIPVPLLLECDEIVNYLDKKLYKFNTIIKESENSLLLLQERRTALISAAVTGKIDVRNWQNPTEAKMEFSA